MYEIPATQSGVRWWRTPGGGAYDGFDGPVHVKLAPAAYLVWSRNASRRQQWLYYGRLYGGLDGATASPLGIDPAAQIFQPASLPYNVIRSGTNTLTAKVSKNRTAPMYLPVGADPQVHRKVKLLNQFVGGLFHKHKINHHAYTATRDATLYGTGHLLIQRKGRRIGVEPLFPWEIYVDPVDARYGEPRSLYLIRYLDKDVLKYNYARVKPDASEEEIEKAASNEDAIETAPVLDESFFPIQDVFAVATRCTVIEAWHLPSGPGAKDGRHVVCLLDHTIVDEPYDRAEFPIARLVKDAPLAGWWGMGLGDELSGFQDEINLMTERTQYAHRVAGGQIWLVPDISETLNTDYNDEIGVVVRYSGGPAGKPDCINPQPMAEQSYQYFKDLPLAAYGFAGISTMSAQAQKPAGVTAALALQTLDDIETDRFSIFEQAREEFHVDIGRHLLHCVNEIVDLYGDFEVMAANRPAWEKLSWTKDIGLTEDSYVVQSWPVSLLPKTPAAKLQRVMELAANGIFDRNQVLKMMGLPDTDAEEQLMMAPRDVVDMQIAVMLAADDPSAEESYQAPGKYQDLAYGLQRAQAYYDRVLADATSHGSANDELTIKRLSALARYMDQCKSISDQAQAELTAMQAAANALAQSNLAMQTAAPPLPGISAAKGSTTQPINPTSPVSPAAPASPAAPLPAQ